MDKAEWNQSIDLRGEYKEDTTEIVQPLPLLENIVERVELTNLGRLPDAEAVISKVVEVAESNHTIERILERKHEVKDFPARETQQQQFAAKVSEVVGDYQPLSRSITPSDVTQTPTRVKGSFMTLATSNSLYGYAVRYGFISALLAMFIAIMVVTLFT